MENLEHEPMVHKLNAWFEVLHRLALIQRDDPMTPAFSAVPLREDIADCVARGWVRAWDTQGNPKNQTRLIITPEGRDFYEVMCQDLADQGRPVTGWKPQ